MKGPHLYTFKDRQTERFTLFLQSLSVFSEKCFTGDELFFLRKMTYFQGVNSFCF